MTREFFGKTADGRPVEHLTLDNGELRVSVLTYGATLQDVRLSGVDRALTIGSPCLADYEPGGGLFYFGAIVGPVANRIRDGQTTLDGTSLRLDTNGPAGHMLHGGDTGLHQKVWNVDLAEESRVVLSTSAATGEGGFPGNRRWEAEFLLDGATLTLKLRAWTDATTFMNLANHSYWNLGPTDDFHGHTLQIDAKDVLPTDDDAMVTGEIRPVDGTTLDFRVARPLGPDDAIDNNFCLGGARVPLRRVGSLTGPDGLQMSLETTEPGIQIYDARHMSPGGTAGHDARRYGPRCGVAIEAQFWPDAPNEPAFPSIRMEPGQPWEQIARFGFSQY